MTPDEHRKEAVALLAQSQRLAADSRHPDAAGSAIREGWAREADRLVARAGVHAALAVATTSDLPPGGDHA